MRGYTPDIQIYFCVCVSATLGELVSVCNIEIVESGQFNLLTIFQAVGDFVDFLANNFKLEENSRSQDTGSRLQFAIQFSPSRRSAAWSGFFSATDWVNNCCCTTVSHNIQLAKMKRGLISTLEKVGYKWSTDMYC